MEFLKFEKESWKFLKILKSLVFPGFLPEVQGQFGKTETTDISNFA